MKKPKFNKAKNILWLCRPYWKYSKLFLILSISIGFILTPISDYIYVYFPKIILEQLNQGKSFEDIIIIVFIIFSIDFISIMIPKLLYPYFTIKQLYTDLKIKRDIYDKAINIDYKYIDNPEYYNKFSWAINEYVSQSTKAKQFIIDFIKSLAGIALLISIIAVVGPWILLIEAIQVVVQILIGFKGNKIQIKKKNELVPINRRLSYFHRLFYLKNNAADIKATSLKEIAIEKYESDSEKNLRVTKHFAILTSIINSSHTIILAISELVVILYLIRSISVGNIVESGLYITMILAFYRLDSKLHTFISLIRSADSLALNAEKIREFFNMKSTIEAVNQTNKITPPNEKFSIEVKNVDFSYENSSFSLSKLNFNIAKGEKVAIVGENGAGKSTFVKLLLRLYDVSSGEILINGNSIKDYNVNYLRQKIGVAFQNPNIYAMTFRENLSLYLEATESDISNMVEKLELESVIKKNNSSYDTELTREFSKDGIMLSDGERQKVALARVLSGEFGLLLLDEPSSALDPIAENKMSELIFNVANKTTTIMVSHRLSSIRYADKIILIENGTIIEMGTHDHLMSLNGRYFEMFTKQAKNYQN